MAVVYRGAERALADLGLPSHADFRRRLSIAMREQAGVSNRARVATGTDEGRKRERPNASSRTGRRRWERAAG